MRGEKKPEPSVPFTMTRSQPSTCLGAWPSCLTDACWSTEKVGPIWLVTPNGEKFPVAHVPAVYYQGQNGMPGVFPVTHYATDHLCLSHLCRTRRVWRRAGLGPRQTGADANIRQPG